MGNIESILEKLWHHLKTTRRQLGNDFERTLGQFLDRLETTLRQPGTTLRQLGDNVEETLMGQLKDHVVTTSSGYWRERANALWAEHGHFFGKELDSQPVTPFLTKSTTTL